MRFCFGGVVASVAAVAAFPASLAAYRVAVSYQVTRQPPAAWATDTLGTWLLAAVVVGALTAFVYTLVERTRLWYLYAALGLFAFALAARLVAPGLAAPFFSGGRDVAPGGRAASAVSDLERKAAAGDVRVVVDADARSALATARIEGFGPNERIVLTQALVEDATPQEVTFVVARELGHHAHGDVFRLALAWALGFVLSIAVAVAVADRIGFRRDDDSISRLPLVGAIGALAVLAVLPLYNAYARRVEFDAVKYAIAIDGDRAGAVRAYVRLADAGSRLAVSDALFALVLTQPPVHRFGDRVRARPPGPVSLIYSLIVNCIKNAEVWRDRPILTGSRVNATTSPSRSGIGISSFACVFGGSSPASNVLPSRTTHVR